MRILAILLTIMVTTMANANAKTEIATFAGGCFWCVESDFEKINGVISVTSGYTGGKEINPTYEDVSAGITGHVESVEIVFDPSKVAYRELVNKFWRSIDPTTKNRQFCDVGEQYRTEIFYHNEEQKQIAESTKTEIEDAKILPAPIVTAITQASAFYPAEEYHQDYYKKNPIRYKYYRYSCGRDQRVKELWGSSE